MPAAGTYLPVGPTRILDTGNGTGAPKAAVGAGQTLTFQVSGRGDVPASGAAAVVLNLTVASPTAAGYLTAYPAGAHPPDHLEPELPGRPHVPNLVVVRLGTGGQVSLYNGSAGTVRLVADVSGYYAAGTAVAARRLRLARLRRASWTPAPAPGPRRPPSRAARP